MPSVQQLPEKTRRSIARQIGERLSAKTRLASGQGAQIEIRESFPIWMIGLASLSKPSPALGGVAMPTGYWHHQVGVGGRPVETARSRPYGPTAESWKVEEVVETDLARKIDEAIEWIDRNVFSEGDARLLAVPAFFVQAIWIASDERDDVVIVDRPEAVLGLDAGRVYGGAEFLRILANSSHVEGLPALQPIP